MENDRKIGLVKHERRDALTSGFGLSVEGLGFRVQGLGFRVDD